MANRSVQTILRVAVAAAATLGATDASAVAFFLKAAPAALTMPDGRVVPVWGYAACADATFAACEPVTVPGPALVVPAGDGAVTVTLKNELPVPTSLVVPAQSGGRSSAVRDVAGVQPGGAGGACGAAKRLDVVTYSWSDFAPGTYLYESGTDPAVQVQMGLYGAVARPSAPGVAYPGRAFATQATLVYSELDPAFHDAVAASGAPVERAPYRPAYFLVNGTSFLAGSVPVSFGIAGRAGATLLRLLNAGLEPRFPVLAGAELAVIAEDGNPYAEPRRVLAPQLAAGRTVDVLATFPGAGTYRLLDGRLGVTDGVLGAGGTREGGAQVYLEVAPALATARAR